jgi:mono/diheme cytochrome c family protein
MAATSVAYAQTTQLEISMPPSYSSRARTLSSLLAATVAGLVTLSVAGCSSDSDSGGTGDGGNTSADPVAAGKALVANAKYACASCHGSNFAGDTKPQPGTTAYPANLTPDSDTGIGDWTTDQIVNAVLNGVDDEDEQLCSTMPVFKTLGLTEADAENIAAYLKSLPAVSHEVPESTCAGKGADTDGG